MDLGPLQEIVYVTLGDTMIEFLKIKDPGPAPAGPFQKGYRAIAIEVEDMDKTVEYLKGQGVEMPRPPMVIGRSKRGEIKDPSGYPIELRQW
jgi:glyoxylase I family protein